jgi:hypothetical protein
MSSSPSDPGDATTGISLVPQSTATGIGNVSANNNCSSYNESPNNNGNNRCDYSATSSNSSKRKMKLADLLKSSPYESEAETYILSALEDRDPTVHSSSRNRTNTGFSSLEGFSSAEGPDVLLPSVPEASTSLFLEAGAAAATDTGSFTRMSQKDLGRGQNGNGSDSLWEGRENSDFDSATTGAERDATGTGEATNAKSTTMNAATHSKSSSGRTAKPPSPASPTRRRQSTTEETLLDLTNALNQANKVSAVTSTRQFSNIAVSGSADALAHNASMLFQRKSKSHTLTSSELDVADSIPPRTETVPGGGAARRRNTIWMGAKTNEDKKTDGDDGIVLDIMFSTLPGSASPGDEEQGAPDLASPGANGDSMGALSSDAGFVDGTKSSRSKKTNLSRVRENWRFVQDLQADLKPTGQSFYAYCRLILYLMVPATGIAFILFYLVDNPPT